MKLTWRLWLLALFILASIIFIVNLSNSTKGLLFVLGLVLILSLSYIKSKPLKVFLIIILAVAMAFIIFQQTEDAIRISSVGINSTAYDEGLRAGQIIISVNGQPVTTISEYSSIIDAEFPSDEKKKVVIGTTEAQYFLFTDNAPEITLEKIPSTNIRLGLDLHGGSRALVQPDTPLSKADLQDLIAIISNRLNVYGLSDLVIKPVTDLSGNNYMLVEIAGASPGELKSLISEQGKFEARIGNETVFVGGKDITHVERSGQTARVHSCSEHPSGYICQFSFGISLTEDAAKKHADITSKITESVENLGYLSESLELYVDDNLVDTLLISSSLKGRVTTQISIQGSGLGSAQQEAFDAAEANMKQLQTILITGSLPYKLEIVKLDTISPSLGSLFIKTIFIAGLASLIAVALLVLVRYRKFKLSLALILTSASEVLIILGVAALFGGAWNLDLPSIAGIIAVIGTGVDHQIVILDESRRVTLSIKERMKRAFFIIFGAFSTTLFAMLPLLFAGAGLLRGFAIATIVGLFVSVFVTRPAFADIVKRISE